MEYLSVEQLESDHPATRIVVQGQIRAVFKPWKICTAGFELIAPTSEDKTFSITQKLGRGRGTRPLRIPFLDEHWTTMG